MKTNRFVTQNFRRNESIMRQFQINNVFFEQNMNKR